MMNQFKLALLLIAIALSSQAGAQVTDEHKRKITEYLNSVGLKSKWREGWEDLPFATIYVQDPKALAGGPELMLDQEFQKILNPTASSYQSDKAKYKRLGQVGEKICEETKYLRRGWYKIVFFKDISRTSGLAITDEDCFKVR